jgi:hypothetical protein
MSETSDAAFLPPKLEALFEAIEAIREETLLAISGWDESGLFSSPEAGWSAGALLEHLLLAERSAGKVVRKVLREAGGALPPYPPDDSDIGIRQSLTFDGMEAPPSVRPGAVSSREALLAQAGAIRTETRETFTLLAAVDPRAGEFPHHRFGLLNLYEWLAVVILEHEKAHRAQLGLLRAEMPGGRS